VLVAMELFLFNQTRIHTPEKLDTAAA